jgi:hypothetical protein
MEKVQKRRAAAEAAAADKIDSGRPGKQADLQIQSLKSACYRQVNTCSELCTRYR